MGKLDMTADLLLQRVTWEWQPLDPIIAALIPTIPSGVALRAYEKRSRGNKGTGTRPPLTEQEQKRSGARGIVNDRIRTQHLAGRIEVEVRDGVRYVRFMERRAVADQQGDACPTCKRPFAPATTESKPQPTSRKPRPTKVVYPKFPQWDRPPAREGSSG